MVRRLPHDPHACEQDANGALPARAPIWLVPGATLAHAHVMMPVQKHSGAQPSTHFSTRARGLTGTTRVHASQDVHKLHACMAIMLS